MGGLRLRPPQTAPAPATFAALAGVAPLNHDSGLPFSTVAVRSARPGATGRQSIDLCTPVSTMYE